MCKSILRYSITSSGLAGRYLISQWYWINGDKYFISIFTYIHDLALKVTHLYLKPFILVLERTVRCSRTVWFLMMFGRFEVRFWAKMRSSEVFEVRSWCLANFSEHLGPNMTIKSWNIQSKKEELFSKKL